MLRIKNNFPDNIWLVDSMLSLGLALPIVSSHCLCLYASCG